MTVIIAGSRSIQDGNKPPQPELRKHNLALLDETIKMSGFHTTVVNLHSYKGPCVKVDRSSPFGNPFTHLPGTTLAKYRVATRQESIERYREWFPDQTDLHALLPGLRGQRLGCWCVDAQGRGGGNHDCHALYLADLAGRITRVVSGTARGVDTLGEIWAEWNGIEVLRMAADWSQGRGAGYKRNTAMAELPETEGAVILWDGVSRGSAGMRREMERLGKSCFVQKVRVENGKGYAEQTDD